MSTWVHMSTHEYMYSWCYLKCSLILVLVQSLNMILFIPRQGTGLSCSWSEDWWLLSINQCPPTSCQRQWLQHSGLLLSSSERWRLRIFLHYTLTGTVRTVTVVCTSDAELGILVSLWSNGVGLYVKLRSTCVHVLCHCHVCVSLSYRYMYICYTCYIRVRVIGTLLVMPRELTVTVSHVYRILEEVPMRYWKITWICSNPWLGGSTPSPQTPRSLLDPSLEEPLAASHRVRTYSHPLGQPVGMVTVYVLLYACS